MLFPFILHSPPKMGPRDHSGNRFRSDPYISNFHAFSCWLEIASTAFQQIPGIGNLKPNGQLNLILHTSVLPFIVIVFVPKNTANQVNFSGTAEKRRRSNSAGSNYGPNPLFNHPLTTSKKTKPACIGSKHFLKNFLPEKSRNFLMQSWPPKITCLQWPLLDVMANDRGQRFHR